MKRILIIEREYGCGAAEIAEQIAARLGWRLLDQELTHAIARLAKVAPEECARREERLDSWLYRLGKTFWRGSYERTLPLEGPEILDADRMLELVRQVVLEAAQSGHCVIVGRGAPYFLRNRSDTFSVFLYAPRAYKLQRVEALVKDHGEAERLVDQVDADRAAFIKHYFGRNWPNRHLYHLLLNTVVGTNESVEVLLRTMETVGASQNTALDMD